LTAGGLHGDIGGNVDSSHAARDDSRSTSLAGMLRLGVLMKKQLPSGTRVCHHCPRCPQASALN